MFLRLSLIIFVSCSTALPSVAGPRIAIGHDHPALLTLAGNPPSHSRKWRHPKDVYSEFTRLDPKDCSRYPVSRYPECAELETGGDAIPTPGYFNGNRGEGNLPVTRRTYPTEREQPHVVPARRGVHQTETRRYDLDETDERYLRGMASQLLLVTFEGQAPPQAGLVNVHHYLKKGDVGGALIRPRNVSSATQLEDLSKLLSAGSQVPPLILIERPGASSRLSLAKPGFSLFPAPREIGDKGDALEAFDVYQRMAKELNASGISMNVGPLADICRQDPSRGEDICYSNNTTHAAAFTSAFIFAHREQQVLSALRFKAGSASIKYLQMFNLVLNRKAPDAVFVDLDYESGKATDKMVEVQEALRRSGFQGVIIHARSDVLSASRTAEALINTLNSGADMLLFMPSDDWSLQNVVDELKLALSADRLPWSRFREAFETVYQMNWQRRQWLYKRPGGAADATSSIYRHTVR